MHGRYVNDMHRQSHYSKVVGRELNAISSILVKWFGVRLAVTNSTGNIMNGHQRDQ